MSKISDRELEQLEIEDLGLPVERIKRKGKLVRQDKYPKKKSKRRENQDWIYERLDQDDTE